MRRRGVDAAWDALEDACLLVVSDNKNKNVPVSFKVDPYDRYKWSYNPFLSGLINGFSWGYFTLLIGVVPPYL